ncbi:MAG: M23 family metallopeptidase [Myxococcota bacterium]
MLVRPLRLTRIDGVLWGVFALLLLWVAGFRLPAWAESHGLAHHRYRELPVAQHFDFPVGGPNAEGFHRAQRFGENLHLGEDWNREGDDEADRGAPVKAIATGRVTYAGHAGPEWGHVVRIVHHLRRHGRSSFVESVYAHLDRVDVKAGQSIERGGPVGTIGDADGRYGPHLHLEIRREPDLPLGPGYSSRNRAWLDPTAFILDHR